jgi:hypothetical protein
MAQSGKHDHDEDYTPGMGESGTRRKRRSEGAAD